MILVEIKDPTSIKLILKPVLINSNNFSNRCLL